MADDRDDAQERTEEPTARRLHEARQEGQVARSADLGASAVLVSGALVLGAAGGVPLAGLFLRVMREGARSLSGGALTADGAVFVLRGLVSAALLALAPFAAAVVIAATGTGLVQTRGLWTLGPITPKWSHLSPGAGLRRIVNLDALMQLLKSIAKLALLTLVTWHVLRRAWPEMLVLPDAGVEGVVHVLRGHGLRLVLAVGTAFLVVALADWTWQAIRLHRRLRMTRQEVVLEARESDGDPQVKARIRQMQRQRARQRMLQAVPTADVVVTNPTHVAVALRYDVEESPAPVVVAMGERKLAERIKAIARDAGVPCVENVPVARALLATATIGQAIPPALYAAVAEILAWLYRRRAAGLVPPRRERGAVA